MKSSSRSQTIGLVAVAGIIALGMAGKAYQQRRVTTLPPIVLNDPTNKASLTSPPLDVPALPPILKAKTTAVLPSKMEEAFPVKPSEIVVHVTGAVKKPGVYHLSPQAREEDAVKAAGGVLASANVHALNLAAHAEDGSQIHVPTKKEAPPQSSPDPETLVRHDPAVTKSMSSARVTPTSVKASKGTSSGKGDKLTPESKEKINLNTAGSDELQRLPGIGPAMAERVLAYRKEAGGFKTIEEMMQVKGIGEKKYAKMERFLRIK